MSIMISTLFIFADGGYKIGKAQCDGLDNHLTKPGWCCANNDGNERYRDKVLGTLRVQR
ncbi:BnaA09g46520D [Brassica napus]|uniref:(rape) hypothetical protein n=1 Tax=Brassica napus TaxID=3708 RepID=A0A078GJE1_BRANA|nr:unnamed protein product [Brassica napus]CDY26625.1 BnaA09g46520D [Brassica napus]